MKRSFKYNKTNYVKYDSGGELIHQLMHMGFRALHGSVSFLGIFVFQKVQPLTHHLVLMHQIALRSEGQNSHSHHAEQSAGQKRKNHNS